MNKIAFMFPGQGAQYMNMGKELYDNFPVCKEIFDKADNILDVKISELCFDGDNEKLNKTEYTQPALLTVSTGIAAVLKENNIEADVSAGLSLGEYSALVNSSAMDFEDAVSLVRKRGKFMQEAVPENVGGMIAVLKLEDNVVEELCKKASSFGTIECANFNCKGQVVVAGENAALDEMLNLVKEAGGRGIKLKVSAPFHCSMLKSAAEKLEKELKDINISEFKSTVYSNVKGTPYEENDDVKGILTKQVMKPVLFNKIIQNMLEDGVDTFVEVGPGKTLSGFVKKTNSDVNIFNIEDINSLNKFINWYKENKEVL